MGDVLGLFKEGLLAGRRYAVAGPARSVFGDAIARLGGEVVALDADLADEAAAEAAAAALGALDAVIVDAGARFAAAASDDGDESAPLRAAADGAWTAVRSVANAAWIERDGRTGGKVVLVAPTPDAGPHAEAARAALENMARTLSIEWSRHGIRTTAVTPAAATPEDDVAALVAYLLSPAGDYFSGARLELTG